MNVRFLTLLFLLSGVLTNSVHSSAPESFLQDLVWLKPGLRSRRASSYDRSGGPNDFVRIPSGQRRVLLEAEGAGMITHLWFTMDPPPPQLSRNDVILRMYWDGNEDPCVESPIGPFFGQGWDETIGVLGEPRIRNRHKQVVPVKVERIVAC